MNILEYKKYDTQNGPGIRTSFWFAGCKHHCQGCWSPQTWSFDQGTPVDLEKITEYSSNPHIDGVSLLGGEPLSCLFYTGTNTKEQFLDVLKAIRKGTDKPIWCWTGFLYEQVEEMFPEALDYIDVLIDGHFHLDERDLTLKWRGSRNQRVIDVRKSRNDHNITLMTL